MINPVGLFSNSQLASPPTATVSNGRHYSTSSEMSWPVYLVMLLGLSCIFQTSRVAAEMSLPQGWKIGPTRTLIDNQVANPTLARIKDGYLISWNEEKTDGSKSGILAGLFNPDLSIRGSKFIVNNAKDNDQYEPVSISIYDQNTLNGVLIAWKSLGQVPGTFSRTHAQLFDAEGAQLGDEFQIGTGNITQVGDHVLTSVNGGFLIVVPTELETYTQNYNIIAYGYDVNWNSGRANLTWEAPMMVAWHPGVTFCKGTMYTSYEHWNGRAQHDIFIRKLFPNNVGPEIVINTDNLGNQQTSELTCFKERLYAVYVNEEVEFRSSVMFQELDHSLNRVGQERTLTTVIADYDRPRIEPCGDALLAGWTEYTNVNGKKVWLFHTQLLDREGNNLTMPSIPEPLQGGSNGGKVFQIPNGCILLWGLEQGENPPHLRALRGRVITYQPGNSPQATNQPLTPQSSTVLPSKATLQTIRINETLLSAPPTTHPQSITRLLNGQTTEESPNLIIPILGALAGCGVLLGGAGCFLGLRAQNKHKEDSLEELQTAPVQDPVTARGSNQDNYLSLPRTERDNDIDPLASADHIYENLPAHAAGNVYDRVDMPLNAPNSDYTKAPAPQGHIPNEANAQQPETKDPYGKLNMKNPGSSDNKID